MPRQRVLRKHYLNLASLINRARHHPYNLRRSTMRRGLRMGLTSATVAAQTLPSRMSVTRSIQQRHRRNQQFAAQTIAMAMGNCRPVRPHSPAPQLRKRQQQRYPRLRMPSAVAEVSAGHLHLAEVQIAEGAAATAPRGGQRASRKRRHESPQLREKPSTIILHRNPRFNALGITCSGMIRQDTNENVHTENGYNYSNNNNNVNVNNRNKSNKSTNNIENIDDYNANNAGVDNNNNNTNNENMNMNCDVAQGGVGGIVNPNANIDNEATRVGKGMRDARPATRKSARKDNTRATSRAAKKSNNKKSNGSTSSKETDKSDTTATSSGDSKGTSDESNSYDAQLDDVFPKAQTPKTVDKINKEIQAEVAQRTSRKRKRQTVPEILLPTAMPPPMLPPSIIPASMAPPVPAAAIGCPTLSAILLSVDNFLKRRRMASCTR